MWDNLPVILTVVFGTLAQVGVVVGFRVSLEHRLTRLETIMTLRDAVKEK